MKRVKSTMVVVVVALSMIGGGTALAWNSTQDNPTQGQSGCENIAIAQAQAGLTAALRAGQGGKRNGEKQQRILTRAVRASLPGIETGENCTPPTQGGDE